MLLVSFVAADLADVFPKDFSLRRHRINLLARNLHGHINVIGMHDLLICRVRVHKLAHKGAFLLLGRFDLELLFGHGVFWRRTHWIIRIRVILNLLNRASIVVLKV